MSFEQIKFTLFTIVCVNLLYTSGYAKGTQDERHIEVALRMVGHQILLNSGDSTTRVLPISMEDDRYKIQFASEFEFIPQDLVNTVNRVMNESDINTSYILEVEECDSKEVVYSYEMNNAEQSDIIPCVGRVQPKSCYIVFISLMESSGPITALDTGNSSGNLFSERSQLGYILVALILGLCGLAFIMMKRKQKQEIDPHIIPLGEYQFDKRNTELLYDQKRIELTSKEADLLILLYDAANTTIERDVILKMVWGDEGDYVGRTLDVFISKLRKKLQDNSSVKIVNIRGVGYKLVMDV